MKGLTETEIAGAMMGLPAWRLEGKEIVRDWKFPKFMDSIRFVSRVAELAETEDHHPDILIRYNRVELRLSTHDAGGLSSRDMRFAKLCDAL